jgi:hypothetical protein
LNRPPEIVCFEYKTAARFDCQVTQSSARLSQLPESYEIACQESSESRPSPEIVRFEYKTAAYFGETVNSPPF